MFVTTHSFVILFRSFSAQGFGCQTDLEVVRNLVGSLPDRGRVLHLENLKRNHLQSRLHRSDRFCDLEAQKCGTRARSESIGETETVTTDNRCFSASINLCISE